MQKIHCDKCDTYGEDIVQVSHPHDQWNDSLVSETRRFSVDLCPICFNAVLIRVLKKVIPDEVKRGQFIKASVDELLGERV